MITRRARTLRAVVLLAVLGWLAAPAWSTQIDDQFITLAIAHRWAETGLPTWGTGALVEACSSFLQLSLATLWVALGGGDAAVFVKVLAAGSAAGLLLFANARTPLTTAGTLLLVALVAWEPTAFWALAGMETTLYALLLTTGWVWVLDPRGRTEGIGLGALALAATAHPEGNLHFALAAGIALARTTVKRAPPGRGLLLSVGALLAWHALRVALYGHFAPTSYLVKIASDHGWSDQAVQVGLSGITAIGVLASLPARRAAALAFVPLLVQVVVALRAEVDWMGHARHLLPGVWATSVAFAPPPRSVRSRCAPSSSPRAATTPTSRGAIPAPRVGPAAGSDPRSTRRRSRT